MNVLTLNTMGVIEMKRLMISLIAALGLVFTGCASGNQSKKEDDKEQKQQSSKEKEKEKEGDEHPGDEKEGDEHPGDEKEGDEHPGDEKEGDEHPGDDKEGEEHPGDEAEKESYSASDIKTAMKNHIEAETNDDGIFKIKDSKTDEKLKLKFVKIHDPVREMEDKGYFACTNFHVEGKDKKMYDLDFWLEPKDGSLKVYKTKIHKHPVKKDGKWKMKARYTFKDDEIAKVE